VSRRATNHGLFILKKINVTSNTHDTSNPPEQESVWATAGLKSEEFIRFLMAKKKGTCPSCHENKWETNDLPPNKTAVLPSYDATKRDDAYGVDGPFPTLFLGIIPISCVNCGLTQLYSAQHIRKWCEENPA